MTLLFDLDDTLVPSTQAYAVGMGAVEVASDDPIFLQAREDVKRLCPKGYPASRSRRLYFKRYLELRGVFTPPAHLRMCENYERAVCSSLENAWKRLNRAKLFAELKCLGIVEKIGIVTNESTTFQSAKLAACDPKWSIFNFLVTSEEVGHEKPDKAIFLRALEVSGANPADCVFIGDDFDRDILPARALGMRTILSHEFTSAEKSHDEVVATLDELPRALAQKPRT